MVLLQSIKSFTDDNENIDILWVIFIDYRPFVTISLGFWRENKAKYRVDTLSGAGVSSFLTEILAAHVF